MYLQPWQIFAGGCVVGVVITLFVLGIVIVRLALRGGVGVAVRRDDKEDKDNG